MNILKTGTDKIIFHINDLDITVLTFTKGTFSESYEFNANSYQNATDKYTLTLSTPQTTGEATLKIFYRGYMRDDMEGFYRSYYIEKGEKVWMGSTQFQQTEARRAFPCFDVRHFVGFFYLNFISFFGILLIGTWNQSSFQTHVSCTFRIRRDFEHKSRNTN